MTNEEKTERLEEIADNCEGYGSYEQRQSDPALLREAAAMMRERGAVQWVYTDTDRSRMTANYKGWMIHAYPSGWWCCLLDSQIQTAMEDVRTLPAAQAAAVAWVDEQEGRNV